MLRPASYADVPNLLTSDWNLVLWCRSFNGHGDSTILSCGAGDGLRFTLWSVMGVLTADCGGWCLGRAPLRPHGS
ncbi:hypothetical protein XINFAN_02567 [Pseudogemmobacter humi]|uniref:Uncharacterized protein n=1 Tax=Pseudogemmobacter humi TaxID=2483812 RepID=A0A3P5X7X6_9RHOB|nr:hypothetical protein XINFAN_02567 [Pseudogemmobacter humi]